MTVAVLGFSGCLGSAFLGAVDMLTLSRQMLARESRSKLGDVLTVSLDGLPIEDNNGRRLEVDANFESVKKCSAIIIPAYACKKEEFLATSPEVKAAAAWLRRQYALGAIVSGSCNGVFLLGEAGLLDGRRCTTTWWRHDELKLRYPRAKVVWGASLIEDNRVMSSGGPLSWIDLSLRVIRELCGGSAAKTAADFTVVDTAPSTQTICVPPDHLSTSNQFLLEAEHIVRKAGPSSLTAQQLAQALNWSERTLHRRLKEASGETPKSFIDRVRFETARLLLETTSHSVKQLAESSGYADQASFRRAFHRHSGMTPGAYRSWSRNRHREG